MTPTAVMFDLDPGPPAGLAEAARVALRLKAMLDGVKLKSFAKLSGGRGIHVLVPLNDPAATFEQTRYFAKAAAVALARDDPKGVTASMVTRLREGKVFIDWWQNDPARTTVCTYSVRAREQPTVSMPVPWPALEGGRWLPPC